MKLHEKLLLNKACLGRLTAPVLTSEKQNNDDKSIGERYFSRLNRLEG
jgi:hypothetical protein